MTILLRNFARAQRPLNALVFCLLLALWASATQADELTAADAAPVAAMNDQPLPTIDGGELMLNDLHGQVVLLDFWASWCGPCRESFPWMNQVQQRYGDDGLVIVGVNLDQDTAAARAFLDAVPADFTIAFDSQGQWPEAYGLIGMPSSYLIDRQGRVRATHTGFHSGRVADYEASIQQLLAE